MKDLLEIFEKVGVRYALVGGYAVNYYGYMRLTQDIDILVYPSLKNAERVMTALGDFGFGAAGIPQHYFEREGAAIHLGVEPNRIDLLTHLQGVSNEQIFANLEKAEIDGISLPIIARSDLIAAKKLSNRLRDQADAEQMEKSSSASPPHSKG